MNKKIYNFSKVIFSITDIIIIEARKPRYKNKITRVKGSSIEKDLLWDLELTQMLVR